MSFNRFSRKRDANSKEIIAEFLAEGIFVWEIERPVDLLCADHTFFTVEIKTEKGRERGSQIMFRADCKAMDLPHYIVRTTEEVEKLVNSRRKKE